MNQDRAALGQRIRKARRARQRTQAWLAQEIGIETSNVSSWERGRTSPATVNLSRLAHLLDIDVNWLTSGKGDMDKEKEPAAHQQAAQPALERDQQELLTLYGKLTKQKRQILLRFVREWTGGR